MPVLFSNLSCFSKGLLYETPYKKCVEFAVAIAEVGNLECVVEVGESLG